MGAGVATVRTSPLVYDGATVSRDRAEPSGVNPIDARGWVNSLAGKLPTSPRLDPQVQGSVATVGNSVCKSRFPFVPPIALIPVPHFAARLPTSPLAPCSSPLPRSPIYAATTLCLAVSRFRDDVAPAARFYL